MKKHDYIADGGYIRERVEILKDLCIWKRMTIEEKAFFKLCRRCKAYNDYALDKEHNTCPCHTCEHHNTEIVVDNKMITLRRKYL